MIRPRYPIITLISLTLFSLGMVSVDQVQAGPVTNNTTPGQAPFSKLTIYQRAWKIMDASGRGLEFSNTGQDVISTHDLVLRPTIGATSPTSGVVIHSDGVSANVYVSGRLCLVDTAHCDVNLPAGGSPWQQASRIVYGLPYTALATTTPGLGLHIGSASTRVNGTAVTITQGGNIIGNNSDVVAINYSSAANTYAARFLGDLVVSSAGYSILGSVYVNGGEVWSPARHGVGTGLDGDLMNGNQITVEPASSCSDAADGYPHVACVCIQTTWVYENFYYNQQHQGKHCTDLANRP